MATETRICHLCGTTVGAAENCPTCVAAFPNRRKASAMTLEERAAEVENLIGVLEYPFDMLHERITELVGRDVWTHELAHPEGLVAEIRGGRHASFGDVIGKLDRYGKPVIVVVADGEKGGAS